MRREWVEKIQARFAERSPWTPEKIADLRQMWADGLSTKGIADRLGFSKNAVVGRVYRMGLPGRGSPIIRAGSPRSVVARAGVTTLPPLISSYRPEAPPLEPDVRARAIELLNSGFSRAAVSGMLGVVPYHIKKLRAEIGPAPGAVRQQGEYQKPPTKSVPPKPVFRAPLPVVLVPVRRSMATGVPSPSKLQCSWLDGHRWNYFQCMQVAVLGRPYCSGHCRDAYVRVRDRREEAA